MPKEDLLIYDKARPHSAAATFEATRWLKSDFLPRPSYSPFFASWARWRWLRRVAEVIRIYAVQNNVNKFSADLFSFTLIYID